MLGVTPTVVSQGPNDLRQLFLSSANDCTDLIADPLVGAAWAGPSVLDRLTVGALVGHLSRGILQVEWFLDADPLGMPSGDAVISASQYFAPFTDSRDLSSPTNRAVQDRGSERAELGQAAIVAELRACLQRLPARLAAEPADRRVEALGSSGIRGRILLLDEYLKVRVVDQTVHYDDLSRSVAGRSAPPVDRNACESAIATLVGAALARHGALAVLHALTRRECDTVEALRVL